MTTETSIYEYAKQGLALSADKPALWFYGKSLTYRELFRCIDNVADNLYALGVREGTVVTIHLPNCPQAVMAIYAVAKLGGICNMVHPQMPKQPLMENMTLADSKYIITCSNDYPCDSFQIAVELSHHMGPAQRWVYYFKNKKRENKVLFSFEQGENKSEHRAIFPDQQSLGRRCAVYMHSSGTMGKPQVAMLSHQAINNWVQDIFDGCFHKKNLTEQRALEVLPVFHGTGFAADMHLMLSGGAEIIQMAKWDSALALRYIEKKQITYISAVPRMYQLIFENPRFSLKRFKSLWRCGIGGDIVPLDLKKRIDACLEGKRHAHESYGMTETVSTCFLTWEEHDRIDASGYPINEQCRAAVKQLNGVISSTGEGEILISSNTLMMGYLKDAEATEKAFLNWNGKTWFQTGDYGRIDKEGYVYFIERVKKIIVKNGYNIYPCEVETVLQKHPAVVEVFVAGEQEMMQQTEKIVAYLVLNSASTQKKIENELHELCVENLPRYSIPDKYIITDSLPRNMMGKVRAELIKRKNYGEKDNQARENMGD